MKAKKFLEVLNPSEDELNSSKIFAFRPVCKAYYVVEHSISCISIVHKRNLGLDMKINEFLNTLKRFPYKEVRFYNETRTHYLDLDHLRIGEISLENQDNIYTYQHFEFSHDIWKNHE